MLSHLFKLIWNKKRQNLLLIVEMFISFLVIFAVFTMLVYAYNNYKQPMGMNHDNVWVVNFRAPENITRYDSITLFHETLKKELESLPLVVKASFCGNNTPYSMNSSNTSVNADDKQRAMSNIYNADNDYLDVLSMRLKSGRWFTKADAVSPVALAVINQKLEEEIFKGTSAVNQYVHSDIGRMKVIGVVENAKDKGTFQAIEGGLYKPIDTSFAHSTGTMVVKVKPEADAAFEGRMYKALSNMVGSGVEIEHLDKKLVSRNKLSLVPMIIMLVVGGFLIINVALGLFGVLWYNINKRRSEIGLRRAVGATAGSVSKQLVSEALVLSTLALLVGLFFAVQFPLLQVFNLPAAVYVISIVLSVLFIYLLVFLCALYPGKQAAQIYPAVALHEE